jgi:hypothetical protein
VAPAGQLCAAAEQRPIATARATQKMQRPGRDKYGPHCLGLAHFLHVTVRKYAS